MKLTRDNETVEAEKPGLITRLQSEGWVPVEEKAEKAEKAADEPATTAATTPAPRGGNK